MNAIIAGAGSISLRELIVENDLGEVWVHASGSAPIRFDDFGAVAAQVPELAGCNAPIQFYDHAATCALFDDDREESADAFEAWWIFTTEEGTR